jgi:hypothetical protein
MSDASNPSREIAEFVIVELDYFRNHFHPHGGERTHHGQAQLTHKPFVGYALVTDRQNTKSQLLICRHYTPLDFSPQGQAVEFASYLSPLGSIIAKRPGDLHQFKVKTSRGYLLADHEFKLLEKNEFTPHLENGQWDAINNQVMWIGGRLVARSLRKLLDGDLEEQAVRQLSYSVQLPDQAILDPAQDEIFRLPLQSRLIIDGAPGTGKTTVLLKRLSQKTKREFLTEEESKAIRDEDWQDGRNWTLFTPSDLLKGYLKEAMAKELLPASDDHVKVYRTFRLELLRDIGFIRVGKSGFFKAAVEGSQIMKRSSGGEQVALATAFGKFLALCYAEHFRAALQKFNNETRAPLGQLADGAQKVLSVALDILSKPIADVVALREAQQRARGYRKLNEDLNKLISSVRAVAVYQDMTADLQLANIYRKSQDLPGILESLTTFGMDVALFPELPPLVDGLRRHVKDLSDTLSMGQLFHLVPKSFQQFRELLDEQKRFFTEAAPKLIGDRVLTEPEQDVLLFHAIEFVRKVASDSPSNLVGIPSDVRAIVERMRMIVCVDEAADFSPLEIACIERFSNPVFGGVTLCGDLMQRVTEQGLKKWSDLEEVSSKYQSRKLIISYRQTERLFSIAKDLYRHVLGIEPEFTSAFPNRPEDLPALLHKSNEAKPAEHWLNERICEIHALCAQHLPTTAILVAHPDDVEPLRIKLKPILHENGLEVEASHSGQALGDSARVRIFPVEFIKGLEFEAVFYIGLDRMAEIHKDLIDKYVYVGLSRARSFLGVTVERQFPQRLKCIADHFLVDGNWALGGCGDGAT